jgi:hypothetical protein
MTRYEPDELPSCSTPKDDYSERGARRQIAKGVGESCCAGTQEVPIRL